MKEIASKQDHVYIVLTGHTHDFVEGLKAVTVANAISLSITDMIIGRHQDPDGVCAFDIMSSKPANVSVHLDLPVALGILEYVLQNRYADQIEVSVDADVITGYHKITLYTGLRRVDKVLIRPIVNAKSRSPEWFKKCCTN